ncbi:probable inactive receptor kinase At1g27190 [Asparagus officinalis]|uniref:probable inactive receptor kinase At1g27190 n=1 Tax=Asparagus officinalis TaxID=4686 RepID=UPI00098E1FDA|nr:probable inactive receptor kinase At1g27190 [Asparagus officinalis]
MRYSQDFHPDYIVVVGSSGIGTAYHAVLRDGSALTVKRLYVCLLLEKQFRAEMGRIGQIRHPNLVPLLGYCVVEEEKLLIYKHMANGALSLMIRDGGQAQVVLLNEEYESRVIDFSLARLMRPWTSDEGLNTTPFLNGDFREFEYIAPEYATNLVPSTKGDVYGFMVVLLELTTG